MKYARILHIVLAKKYIYGGSEDRSIGDNEGGGGNSNPKDIERVIPD